METSTNQIIIKAISIENIPLIVDISRQIPEFHTQGEMPCTQEAFLDRLKQYEIYLILVAYYNYQPAGYLIAYDDKNESCYCWIGGVIPRFRRKGILKKMVSHLVAWAQELNYCTLRAKTRNKFRGMLSFLIKSGFNIIDFKAVPNISENRILFEKNLLADEQ